MIWILVALQVVDVIVTLYGVNAGLVFEANPLIAQNMNLVYVKPFFAYLGGLVLKKKAMMICIIGSAFIDLIGISSIIIQVVLE